MGLERPDPQERFVAPARALEPRVGQEHLERVDRQIDELPLVVDHQDPRPVVGVGGEPEGALEPPERAGLDAKVSAGGSKGLELARLDPILHGAHGYLAPPRDLTRRQIDHSGPQSGRNRTKRVNSISNRVPFFSKLIFLTDSGRIASRSESGSQVA